jgi:hypothetical protein
VWSEEAGEFQSPSGVAVQLVLTGERAGKGQNVALPDPADSHSITEREGLVVLSLACLIESKIACGLGNLRRTHKDFADVVELIAANNLDGSFARHLDAAVRKEFRSLVRHAQS